ncbi:hypothetical protein NQ318_017842 [Aromia moschata]|uniref:Uncharacterized protein n=1 Tax=Aromia moschata TaxID=1265417 RepID=A0AAV8YFU5_9CUCU|nr:hypothetical protein NQ318_017842 [Aromia moschata]
MEKEYRRWQTCIQLKETHNFQSGVQLNPESLDSESVSTAVPFDYLFGLLIYSFPDTLRKIPNKMKEYPDRHISQSTVSRIENKFREFGNVTDIPKSGRKRILDDEQKFDILLDIQDNLHKPTRQVAVDNDVKLRMLFPDDDNPNEIDRNIWFQQDGAAPHFSLEVSVHFRLVLGEIKSSENLNTLTMDNMELLFISDESDESYSEVEIISEDDDTFRNLIESSNQDMNYFHFLMRSAGGMIRILSAPDRVSGRRDAVLRRPALQYRRTTGLIGQKHLTIICDISKVSLQNHGEKEGGYSHEPTLYIHGI